MGRTVLVTGGAGFIGQTLCRRLRERGDRVIVMDDLSTGTEGGPGELMVKDVRDQRSFFDYTPGGDDISLIFHLACPASPVAYQRDPLKTITTAFLGTKNALDAARRWGAKIVVASTSEVYGSQAVPTMCEKDWGLVNPIGPRACYNEGKRAAEALCFDYRRQYGTRVNVARIFNTYGPGMAEDDGRVVSEFVTKALRGETLIIHGDGSQTRSFCYVEDTVEALLRMAEEDIPEPLNVGNPEEVSVLALAKIILLKTASQSTVWHVLSREDDPPRRYPSISRAKALLGWEPRVSLLAGLEKTIAYFAERLHAEQKLAVGP